MEVLKDLIWCQSLINYLAFVAAGLSFLKETNPKREKLFGVKLLAVASLILQLVFIRSSSVSSVEQLGLAAILLLKSLILFCMTLHYNRKHPLTTAFSQDLPHFINKKGPYFWVRHPFYLSYLLSYLAGVVATCHPVLIFQFLRMLFVYHSAARFEESKFSRSKFNKEYDGYQKMTGMFLPKLHFLNRRR